MSVLTLLVVLFAVVGLVSRSGYGIALALGGMTPTGAALVAGETGVPTFYAVALGVPALLLLDLLRRSRPGASVEVRPVPGLALLVLLFLSGLASTLLAPILFDGTPILRPTVFDRVLESGVVTTSNIAQLLYLALGVSVVVLLSRTRAASPVLVEIAAGGSVVLSAWAWLGINAGVPFPVGVFDNSPGFTYIATEVGGAARFRGIFSEPAGMAVASLVVAAYAASAAVRARGGRRLWLVVLMALAVFLGSVSTSTTFFVAGAVILGVAGAAFLVRIALRQQRLSAPLIVTLCAVTVGALWLLPIAADALNEVINDKMGTSSFDERGAANDAAYQLMFDTAGIGTGLGANRGSSFVPSLLSTVGVVGTAFFVAAAVLLVRGASSIDRVRPVIWAFIALMTAKCISGPDLADTGGVLWMSLGILSSAVAHREFGDVAEPAATPPTATTSREVGAR